MPNEKQAALRTVYEQLCNSYHGIAEFRAKLLGLLPLASAGIFLLLDDSLVDSTTRVFSRQYLAPIGLFGFVVTIGLFIYELRGIQRCNRLIEAGKRLEGLLEVEGQFILRPDPIEGFIGSTLAAQVIYPAVLAGWLYLASAVIWPQKAWWIAIDVFIIGLFGSCSINLKEELKQNSITSVAFGKMLSFVDQRSKKDVKIKHNLKRLKDRMYELTSDKRDPNQEDWQALADLAENLAKIDAGK